MATTDGQYHAVCRDCPFEEIGEYHNVLAEGKQHVDDEPDHQVKGGRIDE